MVEIERTDELVSECANAVARSKGDSEWATACNVIAAIERVWDGRSELAERRRVHALPSTQPEDELERLAAIEKERSR